jgi:hypothetical protein
VVNFIIPDTKTIYSAKNSFLETGAGLPGAAQTGAETVSAEGK